jgi:hypothetical protein
MTHKGAELMGWAQQQAVRAYGGSFDECAVVIAEAYLRGAIDALAEETDGKLAERAAAFSVAASDARGEPNGRSEKDSEPA